MKLASCRRSAAAAAARSWQRDLSSMFRPGPLMAFVSRLEFSELLGQELGPALGGVIQPPRQRLTMLRFQQSNQLVERPAKSADGVGEVVAVVLEDVAPERPVPAGDAGGVEKSLARQR